MIRHSIQGCLLALIGIVSFPIFVMALTLTPPVSQDYGPESEYAAFRNVKIVPPVDVVVPTVVEVPVSQDISERNSFAVYEVATGENIPHFIREISTKTAVAVTAFSGSPNDFALTDHNEETSVDYFLRETEENVAVITLTLANPIESSSIILDLDQYVALPVSVTLTAFVDGKDERIIIASKYITSNILTFPMTRADRWILMLTYAQPLRINEVRLMQDGTQNTVVRGLRFLAQPKSSYMIYHNPDRAVRIMTIERGDLSRDAGVRSLSVIPSTANQMYRQADVDSDGIVDTRDNCVQMANSDQIDIDKNGRGDACDDFDRDGVTQNMDNCPDQTNRDQQDEDGDGMGDVCDDEESRFTEKYPWVPWAGMGIVALVLGILFVLVGVAPKNDQILS